MAYATEGSILRYIFLLGDILHFSPLYGSFGRRKIWMLAWEMADLVSIEPFVDDM